MSHCTVAVCVCVLCIAAVGVGETSDWLDSVSQSVVVVWLGSAGYCATPKTSSVVLEHQKLRYVSSCRLTGHITAVIYSPPVLD